MSSQATQQFTNLLNDAQRGDQRALGLLFPQIYQELKALARQKMMGERRDHTLQATALVHEAYVRLVGAKEIEWSSRGQFFFAAAQAMQRILIDHARARRGPKRGGKLKRVPLDNVLDLVREDASEEILALDEAVSRLEKVSPSVAAVVRLRFYAGLSVEETAAAMNVSPRTVKREWTYARAILYRQLGGDEA
jgi:RNA polymerase sigma factor (TIGR02999 family)